MRLIPRKYEAIACAGLFLNAYLMVGPPFSFVMAPVLCAILSVVSVVLVFGALAVCATEKFPAEKPREKYYAWIFVIASALVTIAPIFVVEYVVDGDVAPLQRVTFLLREIF